jgi:metallo-beta-lactamase family protein
MKLKFLGAAGTVTGSNFLLEARDGTQIMVDCGLQQGGYYAEKTNFEPFAFDAKNIKAVFITHAHLDHIGRIPKLIHEGFVGKVYSSAPTRDFAEIMLLDSQHIVGAEAEREGKENFYTTENLEKLVRVWTPVQYHEEVVIGPFSVTLYDAGHILGSSFIAIEADGKRVVFSGDLGNSPAPIIKPTEPLVDADYCVMESTYGNRIHEDASKREGELEDAIEDTVRNKGVLLIPAFAMERTQELLMHMNNLVEQGRVPRVPIFLDSPLAIHVTELFKKYRNYFNDADRKQSYIDDMFNFKGLRFTLTTEESKEINSVPAPKIIIAGSGMSQGGRILHHEARYLSGENNMILFIGYQAQNSLGRKIQDGAESVFIHGQEVKVRCKKKTISSYSAHADQPHLLAWLRPSRATLKRVFLVHGEQESAEVLGQKIRDELAIDARVPALGDEVEL